MGWGCSRSLHLYTWSMLCHISFLVGIVTDLALAHMVDATQLISLSATVRMFDATHLNHWTNGRCHAKSFAICNCTHV